MKKVLFFVATATGVLLLLNPSEYALAVKQGLDLYYSAVLPSLLPFFFLSSVLLACGEENNVFTPVLKKFYGASKAGLIFVMSVVSGYPVGAKLIGEYYDLGKLNKKECLSYLSFTSLPGPMYAIGVVGTALLGNKTAGVVIYLSALLSAIINGFIYRYRGKTEIGAKCEKKLSLADCAFSSVNSALIVALYTALFFLLFAVAKTVGIIGLCTRFLSLFGIDSNTSYGVIAGILEMSNGVALLAKSAPLPAIAFVTSFGGLSVMMQSLSMLKGVVSIGEYLLRKITHALISTLICALLLVLY